MKKLLLLSVAALGLSANVKAQVAVTPDFKSEAAQVQVAPMKSMASVKDSEAPVVNGPKRSVENSVWYKRPAGTFVQTGSTYRQMYIPPFTDLVFTSMYTDASAVQWVWGPSLSYTWNQFPSTYKGVSNGNLTANYNMSTGTGAFYGIEMAVVGVDTFGFNESQNPGQDVIMVPGDSVRTFANIPTTTQYTGFTDFNFGTNPPVAQDRNGETDYYVHDDYQEYMKAPVVPLYVEGIYLVCILGDDAEVPVTETSEGVTCYLLQAPGTHTQGNLAGYTDTVAVIPINPTLAEIEVNEMTSGKKYAMINAYCMEEDDFGDMVRKPVVLDKDYVFVFKGFNNEGVDFGLYMAPVSLEEGYKNGGTYPTLRRRYYTSDGETIGSYWNYNSTSGVQYNMIVRINGMFDVVALNEDINKYYAPAAGGIVTDAENGGNQGVYINSSFPYMAEGVRTANYQIEGLPDWLSVNGSDQSMYDQDNRWISIVNLTAQALPSDVDGRMATLRFVSEKGAKSAEFTVVQGDVTGINGITDDTEAKASKKGTYNLNGQLVGNDYKGVVIENGKKIIRK